MATSSYPTGFYGFSLYNNSIYGEYTPEPTYKIDGFTYNGKHCSEFGVYYIPKETERGDFFSAYEVSSSERSWVSGGHYYGTRVKSRVFELDCYYEEIDYRTREKIIKWLDRRTHGKFIFDARPYAEYYVYPTEAPKVKDYKQGDVYSGLFTIKFTAFEPFAELTCNNLESDATGIAQMEAELLPGVIMPPAVSPTSDSVLIYNPGTETGHSVIRFKGSTGNTDMSFYNASTENRCTLKHGLNTGTGYIEIDSKTGRMKLISNTGVERTYFAYHDHGYITFTPNETTYENIIIHTTAGSRIISIDGIEITSALIGKYIYADGEWRLINDIVGGKIQTNTSCAHTKTQVSYIVTMNMITITKGSDANIQSLEIICKPEVR